jgi:hypothetical protein
MAHIEIQGNKLFITLMETLNDGKDFIYFQFKFTKYRLKREGDFVFLESNEMLTNTFGQKRMTRESACRLVKDMIKSNASYIQDDGNGGLTEKCDHNKKS